MLTVKISEAFFQKHSNSSILAMKRTQIKIYSFIACKELPGEVIQFLIVLHICSSEVRPSLSLTLCTNDTYHSRKLLIMSALAEIVWIQTADSFTNYFNTRGISFLTPISSPLSKSFDTGHLIKTILLFTRLSSTSHVLCIIIHNLLYSSNEQMIRLPKCYQVSILQVLKWLKTLSYWNPKVSLILSV